MRCRVLVLATFFVAALSHASGGAIVSDRALDVPAVRLTTAPEIDGVVSDVEWPDEARGEGFFDADTNLVSDEFAEFWLAYDENFVYFAGRVKTDPTKIIDEEYRPNVNLRGNDNMRLFLDTFGEANNFNSFSTNAAGATEIELAGGRAAKVEWLGEIEANGRKTETGWECEMRIPWSIMAVPSPGKRTLRFNVFWYRSNKSNSYAHVFTNNDGDLIPKWTDVDVPEVDRGMTLNLLPFLTGSVEEGEETGLNAGLDLKTSVNDQIQVVGTVNPDFRNIENSILDLDFSRFERLANENRPFFQEGNDYLRTGFDQRLFAPQRIANIDAGLNVYGNLDGKTQFGFLTTADFGNEQALATSVTHRPTANRQFQVAFVRNDEPGKMNNSGMLNYSDRIDKTRVFFNTQFTDDEERGTGFRNSTGVNYNDEGFEAGVEYSIVTPDFFPRLGFAPETDFQGVVAWVGWETTPAKGPFNSFGYSAYSGTFDRVDEGGFYRDVIGADIEFRTRSNIGFEFGAEVGKFEDSSDYSYSFEFDYPSNNSYRRVSLDYTKGEFDGIDYDDIEFRIRYRPIRRMQVNLSTQFVQYIEFERQNIFTLNYDIGKFENIGGRLVEENGEVNWYLSYSLSGGRGNEYFLIVGDPRSDSFANRLAFKMTIPLTIKF